MPAHTKTCRLGNNNPFALHATLQTLQVVPECVVLQGGELYLNAAFVFQIQGNDCQPVFFALLCKVLQVVCNLQAARGCNYVCISLLQKLADMLQSYIQQIGGCTSR